MITNRFESQQEFIEIDENTLTLFWDEITFFDRGIDSLHSRHIFLEAFKKQQTKNKVDEFQFNTNGWKIKIKTGIVKSAIYGPLVYGILNYLGVTDEMPSIIVPLVIPFLIDIENIKLSGEEKKVFLNLPLKKFKTQFRSDKEWYDSLPEEIKKEYTFLKFMDLIGKLYDGGLAEKNKNEKFKLYQKENGKFKITFE